MSEVPKGSRPLVRCNVNEEGGRLVIDWPDGRPPGAHVDVSAEVIEQYVEGINWYRERLGIPGSIHGPT